MARLRLQNDTDDDDDDYLPDLDELLKGCKRLTLCDTQRPQRQSPRKPAPRRRPVVSDSEDERDDIDKDIQKPLESRGPAAQSQRSTNRLEHCAALFGPLQSHKSARQERLEAKERTGSKLRGIVGLKNASKDWTLAGKREGGQRSGTGESMTFGDALNRLKDLQISSGDVMGSASSPKAKQRLGRKSPTSENLGPVKTMSQGPPNSTRTKSKGSTARAQESNNSYPHPHQPTHSRPTSSHEDQGAILSYEPPRSRSPHKMAPLPTARPCTPPSSPSKSKLNSPAKSFAARIPPTPHRPSIDDFWSQEAVNQWNDQYSPKKILTSPRKNKARSATENQSEDEFPSPSASPKKSPVKKDRAAVAAKKAFETEKHSIAASFLAELDAEITKGKVGEMARSTGGVKVIWSKKLNTTAGRANWRREKKVTKNEDGLYEMTYTHHASIELAEKVIDCEDRLVNALAHEFCHLANFMVSGIKDNPHGKEFKEWARKTSAAFAHRNVVVTTKHSYEIDYKYVWECTGCGHEYKRHSKSIDPTKHSCGSCKAKLVQTKPVPRANGGKQSEYQVFIKENFQRVKKENPGVSHGVVMELLGKAYRESRDMKPSGKNSVGVEVVEVGVDDEVRIGPGSLIEKFNAITVVDVEAV